MLGSGARIGGGGIRDDSSMATTLIVNKKSLATEAGPDTALLYVLRNDAGLHGPRFGCGLGQCGACTVHVNGEPVRSCTRSLASLKPGDDIVTLEGLGTKEHPHKLQTAFIEEQAVQCGYCINGMIMQAAALLKKNPKPSVPEIKVALNNNLCRCGTHLRIIRAIRRAANA
jgi:nicotinate dehydrogenase subunit A